ncbi:D-alanine--poly(phosphoribitol) ligase subunit DltA [Secundilactobacillus folii]|uniref:D-alanine--D-alanyl carrier protein ligase n=1 Tax=Secundilactobacillus folii TaxID=2678357 RepID=A0A7X2XWM4_9LACO|nr:D-alanine--poly(phosphoribitol) ligase subunit DltA [Secundilactobacillus folii]MTV82288.1 D-alanine--poly(phosphoribitol) ligase subunit DltA [Secundilactobacillus folii]
MINNLIQAISNQAHQHPQRIAFDYLGQTETYATLEQQSSQLAACLQESELDNGPILVFGGQTFDMLVAFLGSVKAGRAFIPVDVNSAPDRVVSILETAQPALVIAVEPLPVHVKPRVLNFDDLQSIYRTFEPVSKDVDTKGSDVFYTIFTSGTTGNPKGVQISHTNLLSFVNWMDDWVDYQQQNVLLQPSFSFDLSVMAIYPTLANGGTLKVLPKQSTDNFMLMFAALPKMKLNLWISTPSLIDICLLDPNFDQHHYPDLKTFIFCGEELTHQTAAKLKQRFSDAHIYNTYGPTEATVAVTRVEITTAILAKYERLPIGYVKPDTQILIDTNAHDTKGELLICGPSVSKGYLNNPRKTAQVFEHPGQYQLYRSGDLGYYEDQLLFYNGRTDFQIKLNGYRIELEEVNHYLANLALIKQGVAVPKYDQNHKVKQLVAVVVPQESTAADSTLVSSLKQQLSHNIMPYMMPQRFIFKDQLPLSANGKVDIKALIAGVNVND